MGDAVSDRLESFVSQVPLVGSTPTWQGLVMTLAVILVFYLSCGSFRPSTQRRSAVQRQRVLSSNIVMMFAALTSTAVIATLYFVAGTDAAFCGFIGAAVFYANSLVCGGAFLGVAVWAAGLFGVLKVVDPTVGLSDITFLYTFFTVALVVAFPAFADLFPGWVVNSVTAFVLSSMLQWGDANVTDEQSWLVFGAVFFLLQGVAHPTYRESATSLSTMLVLLGLLVVSHASALARPSCLLLLIVAGVSTELAVLTWCHNRKPAKFVRYDPHETRASVVSAAVFVMAVHIVSSGSVGSAAPAALVKGLLHMVLGHGMTVVIASTVFGLASRWLPEDSQGWRLVIVDMLMLLPFFCLPLAIAFFYTGVYRVPIDMLASTAVGQSAVVDFLRRLDSTSVSFISAALIRIMSDLSLRALQSHSMTFLPLLVNTVDRGSARSKLLGITFNGGPDPASTPALLELLDEYSSTATFFVTLERCIAYPRLVRAIARAGHEIGILGTVTVDPLGVATANEAKAAKRQLRRITGKTPTLYRPPISGSRGPVALQSVGSLGLTVCMWAVCPWEWEGTEVQVYERLPSFLDASGYIVLLHEVIPTSVSGVLMPLVNDKAVDTAALLLRGLKEHRMEAVSLSTLLPTTLETLP